MVIYARVAGTFCHRDRPKQLFNDTIRTTGEGRSNISKSPALVERELLAERLARNSRQ